MRESITFHIINNFDPDFSTPFEDPEYWDLIGSSPASFSFSPSTEVAFIHFDLTGELIVSSNKWEDHLPDKIVDSIGCVVCQSDLV
jgi:hypothetical protein